MKQYKKTLIGSIVAFILGTSCCWLSSLAIWMGGATLIGVGIEWIDSVQLKLILLGLILAVTSVYLYKRQKI